MYTQQDFNKCVYDAIRRKTGRKPSDEECKAVSHHMEYNVRADSNLADNGYLRISTYDLRTKIISQIKQNLHGNDIQRYTEQYRKYKKLQQYCLLTEAEKQDISQIAYGQKKIDDFPDTDYLKNIYTKYFNQVLMPKIELISMQKINNLKYHGLWHTEQVAMLAIDIAIKEKQNPLPVLVAAALHDCARKTDNRDPDHGINCKPIAQKFLAGFTDKNLLTEQQQQQIVDAVVFHNSPSGPKDNHILDCLQDADSMRLLWSGQQRFTPNTDAGRQIASYSHHEQIKYMASLIEKLRAAKPLGGIQNSNILTI